MANVVKKLYTDGRIEEIDPPQKWNLVQLQKFVGGYIEEVPTSLPHRTLIVNESGLLDDLPNNANATALAHPDTLIVGLIRGNALLITS